MLNLILKYLVIIFIPTLSLGSTLFIGNGGEAFKMGNSYFSRDLVEANVHEKPFFHCQNTSNYLKKIDPQLISTLKIDENLLAQKLCDIDSISPEMSKVFITAIHLHSWTLINEELGLLPDDGPLLVPNTAERVQLANRTLYSIRIYAPVWNSLNPQNKIALFFHEIIFSLLKFNCANESCSQFIQSNRIARQITGLFFSESSFSTEVAKNNLDRLIQLSFNSDTPRTQDSKTLYNVRVSYVSPQGEYILGSEKNKDQSLENFAQFTCETYISISKNIPLLRLNLSIVSIAGFTLEKVSYPSPYGIEYGIKIINHTTASLNTIKGVESLNQCYQSLLLKIKENLQL